MRDILGPDDFSLAELSAMSLDGDLVPVGPRYAPFGEFPTAWQRASALGADLHDRLIAERLTAAWVWGAAPTPPTPHEFCTAQGARTAHRSRPDILIREVILSRLDTVRVAGVHVTTPVRTIADIVRFSPQWTERERTVVASLLEIGSLSAEAALRELDRHKLPHKRRAAERIRDAAGLSRS